LQTTIPWYEDKPPQGQRNQRRDALRVLCQLCRSLRTAFLPLVWQSLEAYTLILPPFDGKRRNHAAAQVKGVGKELLGQLRLVSNVKQPVLYASHIRYCLPLLVMARRSTHCCYRFITVAIYSRFADDALRRLAHAMTLMPNLHTLHIVCGPYGHGIGHEPFQKAFSGLVFPSVRRVILPAQGTAIFECFPEVVEVLSNHPFIFDFSQFLDNLISHCPKVESIGWGELFPNLFGGPVRRNSRRTYTIIACPWSYEKCSRGGKAS
jgi:hypothetical protein